MLDILAPNIARRAPADICNGVWSSEIAHSRRTSALELCCEVPGLDRLVVAGACQVLAVGVPAYRTARLLVRRYLPQRLSGPFQIPVLHAPGVGAEGGGEAVCRRPLDVSDSARSASKDHGTALHAYVPELDRLVLAARQEIVAFKAAEIELVDLSEMIKIARHVQARMGQIEKNDLARACCRSDFISMRAVGPGNIFNVKEVTACSG